MTLQEHYFWHLAEPYIRAALDLPGTATTEAEREALVQLAQDRKLKIHFLKRLANPRMLRALGMVRAAWPESLLDIGTGKGFLLWHLSEQLPQIRAVGLDASGQRLARICDVLAAAGLDHWHAVCADATRLPLRDGSVDTVTLFEVLEHVADPVAVMREVARVARRHVLISVPAKPDDNPEHLRLYDDDSLTALLLGSGVCTPERPPRIEKDDLHYYVFVRREP